MYMIRNKMYVFNLNIFDEKINKNNNVFVEM